MKSVTNGFKQFMKDTSGVDPAFANAVMKLNEESALDKKTHDLAYISVLVTTKMYGGLPFHIEEAKQHGASTEEIKSAILLLMPIIGLQVADALPYLKEDIKDGE